LVAYTSDESGHNEVYVEQFPTHGGRYSWREARFRWRGNGKELFYMAHGGSLMSVDMTSETATPVALFSSRAKLIRR
jgi:hypothetical protein